jgi:Domain of unknown function (DUF6457)
MAERDEAVERSAEDWVAEFAELVGIEPPDRARMGAILKLAATAAHASERTAAPMACFLAGASGRPLDELNEIAERVGG